MFALAEAILEHLNFFHMFEHKISHRNFFYKQSLVQGGCHSNMGEVCRTQFRIIIYDFVREVCLHDQLTSCVCCLIIYINIKISNLT
jgi:hypothetical protein